MDDSMLQHGVFSWNELLTKDTKAAGAFYTQVFGWSANVMEMPGGTDHYTVFMQGERQIGGMMTLPPEAAQMGAPPHWGAYVTVDDVDAVVKKAEGLGARVLVPAMDIPGVGRFSTFMDPQGAVISVITYESKE